MYDGVRTNGSKSQSSLWIQKKYLEGKICPRKNLTIHYNYYRIDIVSLNIERSSK